MYRLPAHLFSGREYLPRWKWVNDDRSGPILPYSRQYHPVGSRGRRESFCPHSIFDADLQDQAIISTTMVAFAFSSILTGLVFFTLGAFKLGSLIGYFPRHILVG